PVALAPLGLEAKARPPRVPRYVVAWRSLCRVRIALLRRENHLQDSTPHNARLGIMRPTMRQGERRTRPGQGVVGRVPVRHDDAAVAVEHLARGLARAARERLIDDRVV